MPGPAPKAADQRRRRNAPLANTTKLPAEGRQGLVPSWPLGSREPAIWSQLWVTPQATMWERLGWTRVVARYASLVVMTESGDCPAVIFGEVRQLEDRLGLSPMAMLRLRWEIVEDEVAEQRTVAPKRERLRVVAEEFGRAVD